MRLWAETKRANGEQRKEIEADLDSVYRKWAEAKETRIELQRKEQERERYLRVCRWAEKQIALAKSIKTEVATQLSHTTDSAARKDQCIQDVALCNNDSDHETR